MLAAIMEEATPDLFHHAGRFRDQRGQVALHVSASGCNSGGMKLLTALALALALLPLAALAQAVTTLPPMSTITFNPGSNKSTMNGQMVPGGRDLYYVQAKAGQTMTISVASAAAIAFQVYNPDAIVARAADGSPLITGRTLPDAGPNDNAQAWVGAIPRNGNYLITVSAGPSGPVAPTPYSLTVSLQ
jgi:hypothetical protein